MLNNSQTLDRQLPPAATQLPDTETEQEWNVFAVDMDGRIDRINSTPYNVDQVAVLLDLLTSPVKQLILEPCVLAGEHGPVVMGETLRIASPLARTLGTSRHNGDTRD